MILKKMTAEQIYENVPKYMLCPITNEIMMNQMIAKDDHTYEIGRAHV